MRVALFGRPKRRYTVAVYPDGRRFTFRKVRHGGRAYWQYDARGSAAFPLSVAKQCARDDGATIETELR